MKLPHLTTRPGVINLEELNQRLVEQDDELRAQMTRAIQSGNPEVGLQIFMAAALCAIHERQGNMITMLLSAGGS